MPFRRREVAILRYPVNQVGRLHVERCAEAGERLFRHGRCIIGPEATARLIRQLRCLRELIRISDAFLLSDLSYEITDHGAR